MQLPQIKIPAQIVKVPLSSALTYYNKARGVLPQRAFKEFPILEIKKESRILFISPHPDDEALSSFQFLSKAIKQGSDIQLILLTDGNKHGLKATRRVEFKNVLSKIGIHPKNVIYLDHKDGGLNRVKETLELELQTFIADFCPDYVVSPHPKDIHKDHRVAAKIALNAWKKSKSEADAYILLQYLIHYPPFYPWPRKFSAKSSLMPPVNLINPKQMGAWQVIRLKPKDIERKKELVDIYESQLKNPILRGLMYSLIRKNELFRFYYPKIEKAQKSTQ